MKNKIKYLMDEEKLKKYSEILPLLFKELSDANYEIDRRQERIEGQKKDLKLNLQDLGTYVNRRNQIMAMIKDLGLIKDIQIVGNSKNKSYRKSFNFKSTNRYLFIRKEVEKEIGFPASGTSCWLTMYLCHGSGEFDSVQRDRLERNFWNQTGRRNDK